MEVSKKQRAVIKGKLTVFTNYINEIEAKVMAGENLDDLGAANIQRRLPLVEPLLDQFETLLVNLYSGTTEADAELKELEEFQQKFFETTAKADCLLKKTGSDRGVSPENSVANSIESSARSVKNSIKLPTIKLPKFNGKSENWLEFRDLYISLIEENESLDRAQKFHYLKASLEGDAARVIESIKICAANYTLAWSRLQERYNSEKVLIHNHVKSLFQLEPIQKESSVKLRNLLDTVSKHLANIKSLTSSETLGETLIIYLVTSKLDSITMREWEKHTKRIELPTFNNLYNFLKEKSDLLETVEAKQKHRTQETSKSSRSLVTKQESCSICKNNHAIWSCDSFLKLSVKERQEKVKSLKVCILCLKKGHFIGTCNSKYLCNKCHKRHNSLLHEDTQNTPAEENSQVVTAFSANSTQVLLPTASIKVFGSCGKVRSAKILLDSGSQSCFITNNLCKILNLKTNKIDMTILGIGDSESPTQMKCDVKIQSHYNSAELKVSCIVIEKITSSLPSHHIDLANIKIPQNLKLADPTFYKPGNIDMLIGASHFWNLLCIGQISLGHNLPTLQKSKFGWLVSGPISTRSPKQSLCNFSKINDAQNQLKRFWEIEGVSESRALSLEEKACESHYVKTTRRDQNGRFIVSIPLKESMEKLGNSFEQAKKRFLSLEKKLHNNKMLGDRYYNFMAEYETLGHMSIAHPKSNEIAFYLPHHGVLKEESVSTKLRVVFDGSASSTSGFSINDLQMVGPTIQPDLISILLRFRRGRYAISADIEKMYRQVLINPEQRQLQRILWRSDPNEPIKEYNLNTVTYGTSSASFLAIRSLTQVGIEAEISNPEIAKIIKNDFYVDDLLTSIDDLDEAVHVCSVLPKILATGCFSLRKWISNESKILIGIDPNDKHPNILNLGTNENTKTLGLMWSSTTDSLTFKISNPQNRKVTKRIILSETAQIFDPLGLLGACTISAKILLQDLWREKLDWDESVSSALFERWSRFREQLPILNNLNVSRHVICKNPKKIEMHGFCDASINAYGACIYIRSISQNDRIETSLLCAKTKVAPIKPITVPRLELCGAVILALLGKLVYDNFNVKFDSCTYWSDSTIVLGWLRTSPSLLKTFVCNRVAEIQEITENIAWKHVSTRENPADLLSRGVTPNELLESNLWWYGPSWLSEDPYFWPASNESTSILPDLKKTIKTYVATGSMSFDFDKYSNLNKMERIVAYCFRFKINCLKPKQERCNDLLSVNEIKNAFSCLLKIAQNDSFSNEIKQLKENKSIKCNSHIQSLTPFLDSNGLIRVGGRLKNSKYNFDKCHPVLMSGKHRLTKLIFAREHVRLLHAGPQQLLASIRERVWATAGRTVARQTVHQCVKCFRADPKEINPIMADLPLARVHPAHPFQNSGVDYAGPVHIRDRKGRGSKTSKAYICIFICFVTKAVHIELVTSLSTEAFILALRRFVARRGKPTNIYSDNGTCFVGAKSELKELQVFLNANKNIVSTTMSSEEINWHFIPPRSPHFGGLWEASVRSCKYHLKRVAANASLTYEEMYSLLVQIEATMNSRPMSPLSPDPNDLNPLTPAHFMIGKALVAAPDPDVLGIPENKLSLYQKIQQLHQHYWKRWSREYLTGLQQRTKWRTQNGWLQKGAMVLVKEDNLPPLLWKIGRVIEVHPGPDMINRVVTIKTVGGNIKRSFSKICPLPMEDITTTSTVN